jgi:hypothetical protein
MEDKVIALAQELGLDEFEKRSYLEMVLLGASE